MIAHENLLKDPASLISLIIDALHRVQDAFEIGDLQQGYPSAVLLLLGPNCGEAASDRGPCVILNKRSEKVRQPGDICCPGGGVSAKLDGFLSTFLSLPGSPLRRWPYWKRLQQKHPVKAKALKLLLTSGLRESFEEMRLNPLHARFLGQLPIQQLSMFRRDIYPLVCWISRQKAFKLNWEVERLIHIPLKDLFNPERYRRYRITSDRPRKHWGNAAEMDFLCFVQDSERLWGATFRITMAFLEIVFDFKPPDMATLPIIYGRLERNYSTGKP